MICYSEELEKIQRWLSKTTEFYKDWDWDSETLTVYGDEIEKYSRADLIEIKVINK